MYHFIHIAEANKMADRTAVASFEQNQKLQMFKRKFLPFLDMNLNRFVPIHT